MQPQDMLSTQVVYTSSVVIPYTHPLWEHTGSCTHPVIPAITGDSDAEHLVSCDDGGVVDAWSTIHLLVPMHALRGVPDRWWNALPRANPYHLSSHSPVEYAGNSMYPSTSAAADALMMMWIRHLTECVHTLWDASCTLYSSSSC
jgi:hypothetical protein